MAEPILESVIKCPECGFEKQEIMPTDACIYFYQCTHCQALLKPNRAIVVFFVLMEQSLALQCKLDSLVVPTNFRELLCMNI